MVFKRFKSFLVKKKSNIKIKIKLDTKMPVKNKIVEFVGASGIGKSTLFHLAKEKLSVQWKFSYPNVDFKGDVFDEKISKIHWNLLKNKSTNVDNLLFADLRKLQLTSYFNRVLLNNLMMVDENNQQGFFIDEGLCHNFSKELQELNDDELSIILRNRFLIYVKTDDPLIVVSQIRKRSNEGGHTVYHHNGLNDSQLLDLVVHSMKQFESFFKRVEKIRVPFCCIKIEDGLEVNTCKIVQFENKILND